MIDIPQRIPSQIIDLAEKNVEQARGAFLGPCHGNFDGYHSPARLMNSRRSRLQQISTLPSRRGDADG